MYAKPTVGRIVHYQSYGTPGGEYLPLPRAAIVTEVETGPKVGDEPTGRVGLCILNPTGQFFARNVEWSEMPKSGCWSWPPKE